MLANPGEGIEGGTRRSAVVFVKARRCGESRTKPLVEVSTDKASMEVTAEADGAVESVYVKPGDKVSVGGKLVTLRARSRRRDDGQRRALPQATVPPKLYKPCWRPTSTASVDVVLAGNPRRGDRRHLHRNSGVREGRGAMRGEGRGKCWSK